MSAIRVAAEEVQHGLNEIILRQIAAANQRLAVPTAVPVTV
jgi:hypothetical protein